MYSFKADICCNFVKQNIFIFLRNVLLVIHVLHIICVTIKTSPFKTSRYFCPEKIVTICKNETNSLSNFSPK